MKLLLLFVILSSAIQAQWIRQNVDTKASLRGLSVVNEKVVWASGTGGTVIRTIDGGKTWKVMAVPGADKLDFRDIEAFDAKTAYILSIGNGEFSRIYKTVDGGAAWKEQFCNKNEKAFFDAIACWDSKNCVAVSDPVENKFLLLGTENGEDWTLLGKGLVALTRGKVQTAREGEAAFAASGTCLITIGKSYVYLVSGGSDARVFRSWDGGRSWFIDDTPIIKGTPGSGIFSIANRGGKSNVIVGGNYEKPDEAKNNLAFSTDGGKTWTLGTGLTGYRSAVAYIDRKSIIAVGTNGSDVSRDAGKSWKRIGDENLNSVAAKGSRAVWAVGPRGTVLKLKALN